MGKKEGRETNINTRRNTPSKRKMEIRIKSKKGKGKDKNEVKKTKV